MTLAAAYFYRGDSGQAIRTLPQGHHQGRGAVVTDRPRGGVLERQLLRGGAGLGGQRRPLAERALALLAEGQDARNLAGSAPSSARCSCSSTRPRSREAQVNLDKAAEELVWSSASAVDIARNDLARARASLPRGRPQPCRDLCAEVSPSPMTSAPLMAADAQSLAGQICHGARRHRAQRRAPTDTRSCSRPASARIAAPPNCGSSSPTCSRTSATSAVRAPQCLPRRRTRLVRASRANRTRPQICCWSPLDSRIRAVTRPSAQTVSSRRRCHRACS